MNRLIDDINTLLVALKKDQKVSGNKMKYRNVISGKSTPEYCVFLATTSWDAGYSSGGIDMLETVIGLIKDLENTEEGDLRCKLLKN